MVWNTRLCLARWGQPPPPGYAPSWSPVKINPVLAKPRTAGYSIPCAIMQGSAGGSGTAGTHSWLGSAEGRSGPGEQLCGSCGLCCVFPFSVSLLLLFPLFAVLLNCPYPDPPVSACFFPFSSAPRWGEGRPRGAFVAGCSQTITNTVLESICKSLVLINLFFSSLRSVYQDIFFSFHS